MSPRVDSDVGLHETDLPVLPPVLGLCLRTVCVMYCQSPLPDIRLACNLHCLGQSELKLVGQVSGWGWGLQFAQARLNFWTSDAVLC